LITCFFDVDIRFGDIRDQSQKLFEIAPNFGRFLPSQILEVRAPKSCTLTSRHMEKFRGVPSPSPKVISAHALHFWPFFLIFIVKNCCGTTVLGWCGLSNLGHFLAHVKISGGSTSTGPNNSLPKNFILGGSTCVPITFMLVVLVDESSPNVCPRTSKENIVDHLLFRFAMSLSVREIFSIKV